MKLPRFVRSFRHLFFFTIRSTRDTLAKMSRIQWADVVDSESEDEGVFVTVRLPGNRSTHVVMERQSTISDLNQWIENTEGIPKQSYVLAHNNPEEQQYLKRQRVMETLAPSCELQLITRQINGQPRGMILRRCGARMFGKRTK